MRTTEGRTGTERVRNGDVAKKSPGHFERSSVDADCKGAHRCQGVIRRSTKVRSDAKALYGNYKGAHRCQGVIRQLQRCAQITRSHTVISIVHSRRIQS